METTNNWKLDTTHSNIDFSVKHMMISTVRGSFTEFEGSAQTEEEDFTSANFNFSAPIASIDTNNDQRDEHLKSADFFDAEKHPKLEFTSKSFIGDKLIGDLTIKGVTKEVVLNVDFNGVATDPYGQKKAGMDIQGEIERNDFGLTWSAVTEAGNIVVSDKIKLMVGVQFIKE